MGELANLHGCVCSSGAMKARVPGFITVRVACKNVASLLTSKSLMRGESHPSSKMFWGFAADVVFQ